MIERQWTTKSGHQAVVLFVRDSHRCGYVGISKSNSLFGKSYSHELPSEYKAKLDGQPIGNRGIIPVFCASMKEGVSLDAYFSVHGSLTYSNGSDDYPVESSDTWWFGFDCAHAGDKTAFSNEGEMRSLEYVEQECESLSKQLLEFEAM